MSEITDAYTSLSKYCISNPFKFSAEIRIVHQKLHTWLLLNQNLTPLKVNASLKSEFNTQKHCFKSQKHSTLKQQIMQQDKYIV